LRIKRKKVWGEDGVAATVGTILSLMVFLTFLGMFTNQYVPIWMKDNENKHMNQVIGEFSNMKSAIDLQVLSSNTQVATAPIYSPIQLHADGVPIFASPTIGELGFIGMNPNSEPNVSFTYVYYAGGYHKLTAGGGTLTGGMIEFVAPNRYFVQQTVTYENGAIILNQSNGEVVLSGISVKITPSGSSNQVLLTHTSLIGDDKTIGGFGTKSITTSLDYSSYMDLNNSNSASDNNTLTIVINSEHGYAWRNYFSALLTNSGVNTTAFTVTMSAAKVTSTGTFYTVTVKLKYVITLEFTKAVASVAIADIGV
jgi:hypothetical protein